METRHRQALDARRQSPPATEQSTLLATPESSPATTSSVQSGDIPPWFQTVLQQQQLAFTQALTAVVQQQQSSTPTVPSIAEDAPFRGSAKRMEVPLLKSPTTINLADFRDWQERFTGYAAATRLQQDCNLIARRAILRSAIHEDWSKLWTGRVLAIQDEDDIEAIMTQLGVYLRKKRNPLLDRREFHGRDQLSGESIDEYFAALRLLDDSCAFSADHDCPSCLKPTGISPLLREERIRDRLICGLRDPETQQKVLAEPFEGLTLQKTLALCTALESGKTTQTQLSSFPLVNQIANRGKQGKFPKIFKREQSNGMSPHSKNLTTCFRCGKGPHPAAECPALEAQCSYCGKVGHFQSVCHTKQRHAHSNAHRPGINTEQNHVHVNALSPAHATLKLKTTTEQGPSFLDWLPDSGAACDVLGQSHLALLHPALILNLSPAEHILYTADKSPLPTLGVCHMTLSLGARSYVCKAYVVETANAPLLSKQGCTALGLLPPEWPHSVASADTISRVSLCGPDDPQAQPCIPPLPLHHPATIDSLLAEFPELFNDDGPLRTMDGPPMKIELLPEAVPVRRFKAYTVPFRWQAGVKSQLDSMVSKDVIEKVPLGESPEWVHPMVVVPKKNSPEPRITVDLTALNKFVKRPGYPARVPREVVAQIPPGMRYFTSLDARHGYWQVELEESSRPLTTFITPWGSYRFKRNVMGLISAGDEHNRRGDEAIEGIPHVQKIVEDIVIYDDNLAEHTARVRQVLERCHKAGITLNKKKFTFAQPSVTWCGYLLSHDGYTVNPNLVSALTMFPVPTSRSELRSFCGMVQQFEAFSTDIAPLSQPLRALLSPSSPFVWEGSHQEAFDQLISSLTSPRVLTHFDPQARLRLETDAAQSKGLGFALWSEQADGTWKLLQCGSRFVSDCESRYSATEIELAAVVWAIKKCHLFLQGSPFQLIVDHKPLIPILNHKPLSELSTARIVRLKEKLTNYLLTAVWRKGTQHTIVDCFSRFPVTQPDSDDLSQDDDVDEFLTITTVNAVSTADGAPTLVDATLTRIRDASARDPTLTKLRETLQAGLPSSKQSLHESLHPYWPVKDHLSQLDATILLYGNRIIIPQSERRAVLQELHAPHLGLTRTLARARQCIYWPNLTNDVSNMLRSCQQCAEHSPSQQKEPLVQDVPPTHPGEAVAVDLFSYQGKDYLVITDKYSGWPMVTDCGRGVDTDHTIDVLLSWFCTMGVPVRMTSDGGPQFTSRKFSTFCQDWGVNHDPSSPYHHQANGYAEAAVKSMEAIVTKATHQGKINTPDFYKALLEYRNTPRSDGLSPAQRLFGRPMRTRLPIHPSMFTQDIQDLLRIADQKAATLKAQAKRRYDEHARPLDALEAGDIVRVQNPVTKRWDRIAKVMASQPRGRSYHVKSETGRLYWRNRIFLKRYHGPQDAASNSTASDAEPAAPRRSVRSAQPPQRLDL